MSPTKETNKNEKKILERIEDPEKYSGYGLYDPLNQRVGEVDTVFVSEFGEPQYIKVKLKSGSSRACPSSCRWIG